MRSIENKLLKMGYKVSHTTYNHGTAFIYIEYGRGPEGRHTNEYENITIKDYLDVTPSMIVECEDVYGIVLAVDIDRYLTMNY